MQAGMNTRSSMVPSAAESGIFIIGSELEVYRLGFGSMRLPGKGVWGPPRDRGEALRVLRRSVELGINLIDTADSYGPYVAEELIAEALYPYPEGLVIATKAGFERPGPNRWEMNGRPEHLRAACEGSLKRLRVERIDLYQLHRIDPKVPAEDQFGTFLDLQREGKIRYIGLSEAKVADIEQARQTIDVVSVQNRYNLVDRKWGAVLDYCEREGIGFIPWAPLSAGKLTNEGGVLAQVTGRIGATPAQATLAWLLKRSPVMLPIPGTSSVQHLEENVAAAGLELDQDDYEALLHSAEKQSV